MRGRIYVIMSDYRSIILELGFVTICYIMLFIERRSSSMN